MTFVEWEKLANPLMSHERWSLKDPCAVYRDGWFYLYCSAISPPRQQFQVACIRSRDLRTWCEPDFVWGEGDNGYGSPDITCYDGVYRLTYQSWDTQPGHHTSGFKLWMSESRDLITWSPRHVQLARNLSQGAMLIDPALWYADGKWFCTYKDSITQIAYLAFTHDLYAPDSWTFLGPLPVDITAENGQLLWVDGEPRLILSSRGQKIFRRNPGTNSEWAWLNKDDSTWTWLEWELWHEIAYPHQPGFNDGERGGATFIADWRTYDGYFYAFFHSRQKPGPPNSHHALGIARSRDLKTWYFPPNAGG